MLKAIFRKALSDVRGRPLQVTLLFLVIAAAATTLSVALYVQSSADQPYERLRKKANGADVWVSALDPNVDLTRLTELDSVVEVGEPYPVSWGGYGMRNGERKFEIALVGLGPTLPAFDHPVVTEGRWLAAGATDELVLDSGAADYLGLHVGDLVELLTPEGNKPFTLVGFAVTASRNPAPMTDPAFAYVLPETLYALTPGLIYGADSQHVLRVGARLESTVNLDGFFFQLREVLDGGIGVSNWEGVRQVSTEANEFDVIFLNVFAFFALFASGLIIANVVGGQVLTQLNDIGILKAIGFTPRQVTATLLVQNLGIALAASLVGAGAGLLVAPFFLRRSADILGVPSSAAFDPVLLAITVAVIALIVGVFTLVPAWRAGRVSAITALAGDKQDSRSGVSRLASLAARLHLPRVAVVGVKDLARRPVRTAMTVAALVIAVITATFSLGIESTFDKTMSDPTVIGGPPFDIGADRDTFPEADARAVLEANPDVATYLPVLHTDGRIGNRGFDIWAFEGSLDEPRWALREGRMPQTTTEAAVSTTFAREFGVSVGQTVTFTTFLPNTTRNPAAPSEGEVSATPRSQVRDSEVALEVTIVGTFVSVEGEIMHVLRDAYPGDQPPTDYLIEVRPGADVRAVANALIEASGGNLDPEVYSETIEDIRAQWRPVLLGLNLVLFTIAGINLLSSQLMSIRERRRDFAVLKTLGFTPTQIVASVLAGSTLLALVAIGIGIPLGLIASRVMFDILSNAAGIGTGVGALPGIAWLAPLVPIALIVTALASALPARIAGRLQVAEALRYE